MVRADLPTIVKGQSVLPPTALKRCDTGRSAVGEKPLGGGPIADNVSVCFEKFQTNPGIGDPSLPLQFFLGDRVQVAVRQRVIGVEQQRSLSGS